MNATTEEQWTPLIERIDRRPGDVYVIHCSGFLHAEARDQIQKLWKRVMSDAPLLILEGGLKLSVMSGEEVRP